MKPRRDARGHFLPALKCDPAHPWVLLDNDLHEPVIRCATRDECREYRRAGGGKIVHVLFEERMTA